MACEPGSPACYGIVMDEEHFVLTPLDEAARTLAGDVCWHRAFGEPG